MNMKIGVLGGIGPEATGEFYKRLISALQKRRMIKSNSDFPQIIINSIPAEELVCKKINRKTLLPYIKGLKELESFQVDFIVIVCNTIYQFYDYIQERVKTPILNLKKEVKEHILKKEIKSVVVFGTPLTIESGLYEFDGIKSLYPTHNEINRMSKAILRFNSGYERNNQIRIIENILKRYNNQNIKILSGCTEISLMIG